MHIHFTKEVDQGSTRRSDGKVSLHQQLHVSENIIQMKIMKMTQKFSFDKSTVRLGDSSRFLSDCLAPGLSDRVRRMESSNETF